MIENKKKILGLIANIQDYSVHDGYGLRSIVFLKGCPLRCSWCQNPECINKDAEIIFRSKLCINCNACHEVCLMGAISLEKSSNKIDRIKCNLCMKCVDACKPKAISRIGIYMSVEQVTNIICQYKAFYKGSDRGGVTVSGGEPMYQSQFTTELLKNCQAENIHTAMETSGFINYEILNKSLNYLNLILYDVKHMNDAIHIKATGVSNALVLSNLKKLASYNNPECIVRIPLIPNFNDTIENLTNTVEFLRSIGIKKLDILPFNDLASGKYKQMGQAWVFKRVKRQKDEKLLQFKKIAESFNLDTTIGGLR